MSILPFSRHPITKNTLRGLTISRTPRVPCKNPELVADKTIASFRKCDQLAALAFQGDLWARIVPMMHADVARLIVRRQKRELIDYLENLHFTNFAHGILLTADYTEQMSSDEKFRDYYIANILDHVISLAEAVGAIPAGPRHTDEYPSPDVEDLLAKIDAAAGIPVTFPNIYAGAIGLKTSRGVATEEMIRAFATASRIRDLARSLTDNVAQVSVCEIGGGAGLLAYYCHRFGIRNYTIIDLPTVNVLQTYSLMNLLPAEEVHTFDEYPESGFSGVCVYPYMAFDEIPDRSFTLFVNEDSLTEINHEVATNYIRGIARKSRRYFLSLNREDRRNINGIFEHGLVSRQVAEAGGFTRVYRAQHWMLPEFCEELYQVTDAAPL